MKSLLEKLNYKGQERIALVNASGDIFNLFQEELKAVSIDTEIDPRYPYDFIIIFVKTVADVESLSPIALHNLLADGILWFCYPKKSSKTFRSDIDRDHGWESLNKSGLHGIRLVSVNDDWSALRFRNARYIKSHNKRFS
jgi:hypothetical protein